MIVISWFLPISILSSPNVLLRGQGSTIISPLLNMLDSFYNLEAGISVYHSASFSFISIGKVFPHCPIFKN